MSLAAMATGSPTVSAIAECPSAGCPKASKDMVRRTWGGEGRWIDWSANI